MGVSLDAQFLTPLELLDPLAHLVTPPRIHQHHCCGVLAPDAKLRRAVTSSAGAGGATLQVIEQARISSACRCCAYAAVPTQR